MPRIIPFAVLLLLLFVPQAFADNPPWAAAPTTLSVTLSDLHVTSDKRLEANVAIQNTGVNDTMLNVGIMLANGATLLPAQIFLVARSSDGQLHKLTVAGGPQAIAGRIDPMVVPLPRQATYIVHLQWAAYPKMDAGTYDFYAEVKGTPPYDRNLEMPGENLLKCWVGTVRSNEITLTVP
jgi:hypothetical protein